MIKLKEIVENFFDEFENFVNESKIIVFTQS